LTTEDEGEPVIRPTLPVALLMTAFAFASPVHAGDAVMAEALFQDGRALMEAGDYAAACPKLEESYVQDPATGTLLALAHCQESAGQTASAWATYAETASRAKQDGRQDREQAARERMAALEPKLSRLTIALDADTANVPGLVVKRDGQPVGRGAWGTGVPLDPGEHVVEATAPGKQPFSTTVTIGAEADVQTVQIPLLEDEAAGAAGPEPAPVFRDPVTVDFDPSDEGPPLRTIGLITGGIGLVGLGVGGFFGLRAKSLNDESKDDCDANNECGAIGGAKRDDAMGAATISTVAFIAGGVLTAAGVTLFLVGGPKDGEKSARVEATPLVGPNEAAMVVRGRF
jgi:hypothetical protein